MMNVGALTVELWCDCHWQSTYFDSLRGAPRPRREMLRICIGLRRIRNNVPQRAIGDRPYSIHGTVPAKLKFEVFMDEEKRKAAQRNLRRFVNIIRLPLRRQ
jgi:hypothetical protein